MDLYEVAHWSLGLTVVAAGVNGETNRLVHLGVLCWDRLGSADGRDIAGVTHLELVVCSALALDTLFSMSSKECLQYVVNPLNLVASTLTV